MGFASLRPVLESRPAGYRRGGRPRLEVLEDRTLPASLTVTTLNDSGPGSLRQAILDADGSSAASTITFANGLVGTINLASALPTLTSDISIQGPGAGVLTVQRSTAPETPDFGIFAVDDGATVAISGLTIANGRLLGEGEFVPRGGGIDNAGGTLTVTDCTLRDNSAGGGGGIETAAGTTTTVTGCTLTGNTAQGDGGALEDFGTLTVVNSTLSGNSAAVGGAVYAAAGGSDFPGGLTVEESTLAGNSAGEQGGGIAVGFGTATLYNTLVAGNSSPAGPDLSGSVSSRGYNLVGDTSGAKFSSKPTDLLNRDPQLGPLQDNGGPTATRGLLAGSPAIGAGDPALAGTADQRGVLRPAAPDVGAFQSAPPQNLTLSLSTASLAEGQTLTLGGSFLDVAVSDAHSVTIDWGDGTAATRLTLPAGVFGFTATHAYLDGHPTGTASATDPVTVTVANASGKAARAATAVTVANVAPAVSAGPDVVLVSGVPLSRTGSFTDPGADGWTATVNYGDGTGDQPLALDADHTFSLRHVYAAEGTFGVTVRVLDGNGGAGTASFQVDVLLPGVTVFDVAAAPPGAAATAAVPGAAATLAHSALAGGPAGILVAVVPVNVAAALPGQPPPNTILAAYDVRVIRATPGDRVVVTFQYSTNDITVPTITFFDRATQTQQFPLGSTQVPGSFIIDVVHHTITLILDGSSVPQLTSLHGTVFTISIPQSIPLPAAGTFSPSAVAVASLASGLAVPLAGTSATFNRFLSGQVQLLGGADYELSDLDPLRDMPAAPSALIGLPPVILSPTETLPAESVPDEGPPRPAGPGARKPSGTDAPFLRSRDGGGPAFERGWEVEGLARALQERREDRAGGEHWLAGLVLTGAVLFPEFSRAVEAPPPSDSPRPRRRA